MRLVILLLDVYRRRTTKVVTNTKVEEMKIARTTKKKAKSHDALLNRKQGIILMNMMKKWYMLQW